MSKNFVTMEQIDNFKSSRGRAIPQYMRSSIHLYINQGVPPGSFLTAVICNNLSNTYAYADINNREYIPEYVEFFHNVAPSICWGGQKHYENWLEIHKAKRSEEEE